MAPDEKRLIKAIAEHVDGVAKAKASQQPFIPVPLTTAFAGDTFNEFRTNIKKEGVASYRDSRGEEHWIGMELDENDNVLHIAATIPRTPSKAQDFLQQVAEFQNVSEDRIQQINLFRKIASGEGIVHNAINKVTALVATDGSFKVRRIKGVRGKGGDKRADEFRELLKFWVENVNSPGEEGTVTGGRGIKSFISQGVRQALIEGDHFARTNWSKITVPALKNQKFSLPINIQTFGGDVIDIPVEAAALNIDWIDWVPPQTVIQSLEKPSSPEMKKEIERLIPKDVQQELKKREGRYRLNPQLMAHIKHRGTMSQPYGESFIRSALSSIAYKRSLMALDIVTIENLLNRLLIIKIGSDNPESIYHKQEVSSRRVKTLENMMRKVGPHSTILWAGPDIEIEEAGAHSKILEMDGRYQMANSMIRSDLGTPSALLTGEGADGKASALAAIIAVAAQIQELQDQYGQTLRTWAQRIGGENGFEDVDVTWEFKQNPLINRMETLNAMLQAYQLGVLPVRVVIEDGFGLDFEAAVEMMDDEVSEGWRPTPFAPPPVALSTNPTGTGNGGGGTGKPSDSGKPNPQDNKETGNPNPNK
jgi:hypothetical protein